MRTFKMVVACVVVGAMGMTASAQDRPQRGNDGERRQPGGGGPGERGPGGMRGLAPEKAKAAWEAEAKGVAGRLGLKDDQTKALVKAYTDARESQRTAMEKARKEATEKHDKDGDHDAAPAGRGAEMRKMMEEVNGAEREKFQKALGSTLSADQTKDAVSSLGTFNNNWDRITDVVVGFNLDGKKQQEAQNAVETFVLAQGKAMGGGDRESAQEAMQASHEKLMDSMKKVLSDEQFKKFQEATAQRRGPGGGGRDGKSGGG
jgi:hypothetical protein